MWTYKSSVVFTEVWPRISERDFVSKPCSIQRHENWWRSAWILMWGISHFFSRAAYRRCMVLGSMHFSVPVRIKNLPSFFRGAASSRSLSGRGIMRMEVAVFGVPMFKWVREHSFFPSVMSMFRFLTRVTVRRM